jgi:hypothetical protein
VGRFLTAIRRHKLQTVLAALALAVVLLIAFAPDAFSSALHDHPWLMIPTILGITYIGGLCWRIMDRRRQPPND